jgi:hypothetical protein
MWIFKKLFKRKSEADDEAVIMPLSPRLSVSDFFSADIVHVPDQSFTLMAPSGQDRKGGIQFNRYEKKLPVKECGIFDRMEVKCFSELNTHVSFVCSRIEEMSLGYLRRFIDELHQLYGPDDFRSTHFSANDVEAIQNRAYWAGRLWCDSERHFDKPKVMLTQEHDRLVFTIFAPRIDAQRLYN